MELYRNRDKVGYFGYYAFFVTEHWACKCVGSSAENTVHTLVK